MPPLARRAPKLLSQVNGRRYATQDDHEEPLPTPPATNSTRSSNTTLVERQEDINRDPDSSDDEKSAPQRPSNAIGFTTPRQIDGADDALPKAPVFLEPSSRSASNAESRRSDVSEHFSSDSDAGIFSSQGSAKRRKITSRIGNIHVQPRPQLMKPLYGKGSKQSSQSQASTTDFKMARKDNTKNEQKAALPVFKTAKGADVYEFGKENEPNFQAPRTSGHADAEGYYSLSPAQSSLSSAPDSPEVEEIEHLNLPPPKRYVPTTACAICGQEVDLFLKEEFENEFSRTGLLSYKWQQRFCRYHKENEAKQVWSEKGYPTIDWSGLEKRMREHHSHLEEVMSGAKQSHYRDVLSERLKDRSKTALQTVNSDGLKQGAHVGYYGPRGERMMTDHIIAHMSNSLRKQASSNKLITASGVSGGVSGFVQAVLVPELGDKLVREDMRVSQDRAREIIVESAELGDLLNPEIDEKVREVVQLDD